MKKSSLHVVMPEFAAYAKKMKGGPAKPGYLDVEFDDETYDRLIMLAAETFGSPFADMKAKLTAGLSGPISICGVRIFRIGKMT